MLIVTDRALIRDNFIAIPEGMSEEQLAGANKLVERTFVGKRLLRGDGGFA